MIKPFINEKVLKEFEPLYTKAELEIKQLISEYVIQGKPESDLNKKISKVIKEFREGLPKELPNHTSFVNGLAQSSFRWLKEFQRRVNGLNLGIMLAFQSLKTGEVRLQAPQPIAQTLKKAIKYQGFPKVEHYQQELKRTINSLATSPIVDDYEPGKRRVSIFAKAELELRYQSQMDNITKLKGEGKLLRRFTTHASASKRCEPYQGKLVHLELPPVNDEMETGESYNGEKIYSFKGITNKIDKYGYKNNIIVGWNCRHGMIDPNYTDNIEKYTKKEMDEARKINAKMRQLEREVRDLRKRQYLSQTKADQRLYAQKAREVTKQYQSFATTNKVAMAGWRFKIPQDLRTEDVLLDY